MYRLSIKGITYLIIISFLSQNLAWANGYSQLAPDSKRDLEDLRDLFDRHPGPEDRRWSGFNDRVKGFKKLAYMRLAMDYLKEARAIGEIEDSGMERIIRDLRAGLYTLQEIGTTMRELAALSDYHNRDVEFFSGGHKKRYHSWALDHKPPGEIVRVNGGIDITSEDIIGLAKQIFMDDKKFMGRDEEFGGGFNKVRVMIVPGIPAKGDFGAGSDMIPTIYLSKELYDYLLGIYNSGGEKEKQDVLSVFAILLYQNYIELRLLSLYGTWPEWYKRKDYLGEDTIRRIDSVYYQRLDDWITEIDLGYLRGIVKIEISERRDISGEAVSVSTEILGDKDKIRSLYKRCDIEMKIIAEWLIKYLRWILNSYPPETGPRHLVILQRDANLLGIVLREAVKGLGWTHLEIKDVYLSRDIFKYKGKEIDEAVLMNPDTLKEIFMYLQQEGLLDGRPITFVDSGINGRVPITCMNIISERKYWDAVNKPFIDISMSVRLLAHWPPIEGQSQIIGLDEVIPDEDEELLNYMSIFEGLPHVYERPERLVSRDGRIVPDLIRSEPAVELYAIIIEKLTRDLAYKELRDIEGSKHKNPVLLGSMFLKIRDILSRQKQVTDRFIARQKEISGERIVLAWDTDIGNKEDYNALLRELELRDLGNVSFVSGGGEGLPEVINKEIQRLDSKGISSEDISIVVLTKREGLSISDNVGKSHVLQVEDKHIRTANSYTPLLELLGFALAFGIGEDVNILRSLYHDITNIELTEDALVNIKEGRLKILLPPTERIGADIYSTSVEILGSA